MTNKTCPYCGEEILASAIKCKHCQTWLKKKCPYCAEMIDTNLNQCPYCDSDLSSKTSAAKKVLSNTEVKKNAKCKDSSDSGWTIVWKLGLAVIGAAIMIVLFPNMFSDKIVVTNTITGEEIEFPVETIEDEYCVKMSIFEGKEHCFCSADKENLTKFVTHVKQSEIKEEAKMGLDGAMGSSIAKFYQMDAMIYGSAKIQYKIHERDLETSQTGSANTGSEYAQNSAEDGAIEDEYERTYVFHGINIPYNPALSKENEVRKAAKQCYEDGNTTEEDLNQCIGLKLRWF